MSGEPIPGPWQTSPDYPGEVFGSDWSPILFVGAGYVPGLREPSPHRDATVALVKAAPEMLAALKELALIDGSPRNVASAEVLAARVRALVAPILAKVEQQA